MPSYTLHTTPNSARIDLPGGTSIIVTSDSKVSVTVMPDCAPAEDASPHFGELPPLSPKRLLSEKDISEIMSRTSCPKPTTTPAEDASNPPTTPPDAYCRSYLPTRLPKVHYTDVTPP